MRPLPPEDTRSGNQPAARKTRRFRTGRKDLPQLHNTVSWLGGGVLADLILSGLAVAILRGYNVPVTFLVVIIVMAVIGLPVAFYLQFVAQQARERRRSREGPKQTIKIHEEGYWVNTKDFEALLHLMRRSEGSADLPDQEFRLATRRHKIARYWPSVPIAVLALLIIWLGIFAGTRAWLGEQHWGDDGKSIYGDGVTVSSIGWSHLPLTCMLMCFLFALILGLIALTYALKWSSDHLVVSEFQLWWVQNPPIWLPWMEDDVHELTAHDKILYIKFARGLFARWFGWGTFTIDSASQQDKVFHRIRFMPKPIELRKILNDAIERFILQQASARTISEGLIEAIENFLREQSDISEQVVASFRQLVATQGGPPTEPLPKE